MSQTNISFQYFLEVSTWCQLLSSRNIIKMCAVTCFYPSALRGWLAVFITQRAGGQAAWTPTCCEGNNSRMSQRSILKLTPEVYLLKMWISITSSSRSKSQFSENLVNALTPAWHFSNHHCSDDEGFENPCDPKQTCLSNREKDSATFLLFTVSSSYPKDILSRLT